MIKTSAAALDFVRRCCADRLQPPEAPSPPSAPAAEPPSRLAHSYAKWDKFLAEAEAADEEDPKKPAGRPEPPLGALGGCAHDRSQERQIYEKPTSEKLLAAEKFCDLGNGHFRSEEYELACTAYRKGEIQLDYSFPESAEEEERMRRVKLRLHLNFALCALRLRDWEKVASECYQALQVDPNNAKARYRKGLMFLHQDQFEEANAVSREKKVEKRAIFAGTATGAGQRAGRRGRAGRTARSGRASATVPAAEKSGGTQGTVVKNGSRSRK